MLKNSQGQQTVTQQGKGEDMQSSIMAMLNVRKEAQRVVDAKKVEDKTVRRHAWRDAMALGQLQSYDWSLGEYAQMLQYAVKTCQAYSRDRGENWIITDAHDIAHDALLLMLGAGLKMSKALNHVINLRRRLLRLQNDATEDFLEGVLCKCSLDLDALDSMLLGEDDVYVPSPIVFKQKRHKEVRYTDYIGECKSRVWSVSPTI